MENKSQISANWWSNLTIQYRSKLMEKFSLKRPLHQGEINAMYKSEHPETIINLKTKTTMSELRDKIEKELLKPENKISGFVIQNLLNSLEQIANAHANEKAIEFAEWLRKNYMGCADGWMYNGSLLLNEYPTPELLEMFNNQNQTK